MQGEPVGLGYAFQSGIRSIQWPDGANHEGLAPQLRPDSDTIGDRAAQDLGHGIVVFSRVEFQPGALGIPFQQSLAFQTAAYTLTDALY